MMIRTQNIESLIPAEAIPRFGDDTLGSIVGDVASAGHSHWVGLASSDSSSRKLDYIQGIQPPESRGTTERVISLVGDVAHLLEDGSPRVDMRTTLLGPSVDVVPVGERGKHENKAGGYYRSIPFRHHTPGGGRTGMGKAYSGNEAISDAKKLGNAVYRAAKKLSPTTSTPYGKVNYGGRLKTGNIRAGIKAGSGVPLLRPHHKSSIYEGMIRHEKTYESDTQSQYITFRTISTSVNDGSWWMGAIEARKYAEKVDAFISKILPDAVSAYIQGQS